MRSRPIVLLAFLLLMALGAAQGAHALTAVYNCTFASTSCGFDLAPANGVLNVSSTTTLTWNASNYTWSNTTAMLYCPTGADGNKLHIANGATDWLLDGTDWKNEPVYSISHGSFTRDAWVRMNWITNHTANTSIVCIAGSCSSAGAFAIDKATNTMQIETTYAGGDCAYDNMTIEVLDSEAPVGGGGGGSVYNLTYPLLNASETAFWSDNSSINRSDFYDKLIRDQQANGNVSYILNGRLFVPYFSTASSCTVADLRNGSLCDIGIVNATRACMVNDEFSQVGIQVSMGSNTTLIEAAYNTTVTTRSTHGTIPAWKVWRDENGTIQVCNTVNTNCDTASDATARTIIMLYNSANSTYVTAGNATKYGTLANQMLADMLRYEIVQSCKPSHLGMGQICYWLAAGSVVKSSGMSASYYTYTGYFPDAQIAFAQGCAYTGNATYCAVAGNLSLNYLQAAYPNSHNWSTSGVRAPPGKAFHWTNLSTDPAPVCDDTCTPEQWDAFDASRALGYCEANYWMRRIGQNNTAQETYCRNLGNLHFNSTTSTPLQLYPNGTNSAAYQSGYQAQGQGALHQMGGHNQSLFKGTVDSALGHYELATSTFDSEACFGVYTKAYAIRALGEGMGRNLASWPENPTIGGGSSPSISITGVSFLQNPVRSNDDAICQVNTTYVGSETNITATYTVTVNGTTVNSGSESIAPGGLRNISTTDHANLYRGANLTCTVSVTDGFQSAGPSFRNVTVSGALQVLQTAILTSNSNLLNCSYTATDQENDTVQAAYYRYFVNGTLNASTQTLNVTTFAQNTTVKCEITVQDQDGNSTPLNTSVFTVGDFTAPTITNVSIPTTGSITDVLQITATISDDRNLGQGTPVVQFTDPNGQILGNFTMSNSTPTQFYLNRTYNTVGTYSSFKIYATDGSANTAVEAPATTLVIGLPGQSSSGSSSGVQSSDGPAACMFSIVKPVTGALNPVCPAGLKSNSFTVTLFNDQGTAQSYQSQFIGTDCQISESNFTIQPKASKIVTVSGCSCPTEGDSVKGELVFKNGACGNTVQIALYTNFLTRLVSDPSVYGPALFLLAGVVFLLILMIVLIKSL